MKKMFVVLFIILLSSCYYKRPQMIRNVKTISGDNVIYMSWDGCIGTDVDCFRVYRSNTQAGNYMLIAEIPYPYFDDYNVVNGVTYFYAISAINVRGEEGPLTDYIIYDTPRPEGYYANIADIYYYPEEGGWDFSAYRYCDYESPFCDIYYEVYQGTGYIVCADITTDIVDMGWVYSFDDISYAPEYGWSPTGDEIAIPGHVYIIWTRDDNYAKIMVREQNSRELIFDWAYQTDPGNRELSIEINNNAIIER